MPQSARAAAVAFGPTRQNPIVRMRGMLPYPATHEAPQLRRARAARHGGRPGRRPESADSGRLLHAARQPGGGQIRQVGLPVPASNLFLPATLKVTGPAIDRDQQLAYVRKAFARLQQIGITVVVFGSGGARLVPDGFSKEQAFQQLVEFGRRIAPEARAHGITVAVEPLRPQETNIINSAAEGLDLVNAINDPNFQLMVDFYHLASVKEDPAIILRARDHIRHLHMANPEGRIFPRTPTEYDYQPFFAALRTLGYSGRISVEASTKDLPGDAPPAIALLRSAFR